MWLCRTQVGRELDVLLIAVPEVAGLSNACVLLDLRGPQLWKLCLDQRADVSARLVEVCHVASRKPKVEVDVCSLLFLEVRPVRIGIACK